MPTPVEAPTAGDEAQTAADDAGLTYVSDEAPGIRRRRRGQGFSYVRPSDTPVDARERARIEAIAIPPAWTDVWISPSPNGHILATGRDVKARKQYRYHPRWREIRDGTKYHRMSDFGSALPRLRQRLDEDLARDGLPQGKVVAAVVRLLDETLVRIGNEEYAEQNESYGLTTLQDDHANVSGTELTFEFRAKSGVEQAVSLRDRRLARIVRQCQELPGEDLFQYLDDAGDVLDVTSTHVNEYLRTLTGASFTAKDFRTWGGTVTATETLVGMGPPATAKEAADNILAAVDAAAERLGNTRTVCRSCYVHPRVDEAYEDGSLQEAWSRARDAARFTRSEGAVLSVLREGGA